MLFQDFDIWYSAICNQSKSKEVIKPAQMQFIIVGAYEFRLEWGVGFNGRRKEG